MGLRENSRARRRNISCDSTRAQPAHWVCCKSESEYSSDDRDFDDQKMSQFALAQSGNREAKLEAAAHLPDDAAETRKEVDTEIPTETNSLAAPPLTGPLAAMPESSEPTPSVQSGAAEHSLVPLLTMQCAACGRTLCNANQLAFFRRVNKQNGLEVHLMLKPEQETPHTFVLAAQTEKGALHTWNCECGEKLGDTRAVAVKWAPMTAFKSSTVVLGGHRYPGIKSKWPKVYMSPPFDQIQVRERNQYYGPLLP
jgi:hypothetical protein